MLGQYVANFVMRHRQVKLPAGIPWIRLGRTVGDRVRSTEVVQRRQQMARQRTRDCRERPARRGVPLDADRAAQLHCKALGTQSGRGLTTFGKILQDADIARDLATVSSNRPQLLQRRERRVHFWSTCTNEESQLAL